MIASDFALEDAVVDAFFGQATRLMRAAPPGVDVSLVVALDLRINIAASAGQALEAARGKSGDGDGGGNVGEGNAGGGSADGGVHAGGNGGGVGEDSGGGVMRITGYDALLRWVSVAKEVEDCPVAAAAGGCSGGVCIGSSSGGGGGSSKQTEGGQAMSLVGELRVAAEKRAGLDARNRPLVGRRVPLASLPSAVVAPSANSSQDSLDPPGSSREYLELWEIRLA